LQEYLDRVQSVDLEARKGQPQASPAKIAPKNRSNSSEVAEMPERVKGIEPSPEAWEGILRPLISLRFSRNQNDFSILEFHGGSGNLLGFPIVCTLLHAIGVQFPFRRCGISERRPARRGRANADESRLLRCSSGPDVGEESVDVGA
jgi:hypothetical protein